MTVQEAIAAWKEKYPEVPVTTQTIRNWAKKKGLGEKSSFLPRSHWRIDRKKFMEFLENPKKYF